MMQNARNTIPLSKQVQYFDATTSKMVAEVGSGAVSTLLARSVFLISAGNNDLFAEQARNRLAEQQRSDAATFFADLISNYSATIMVRNPPITYDHDLPPSIERYKYQPVMRH